MRPTLAAEELKRNPTEYLTTTFALTDRLAREGLERFLNDLRQGMFRGPVSEDQDPVNERGRESAADPGLGAGPGGPVPRRRCANTTATATSPEIDQGTLQALAA